MPVHLLFVSITAIDGRLQRLQVLRFDEAACEIVVRKSNRWRSGRLRATYARLPWQVSALSQWHHSLSQDLYVPVGEARSFRGTWLADSSWRFVRE